MKTYSNLIVLITLLIVLLCSHPLRAQNRIGDWQSYTSMMNVREIHLLDNKIFGATGGGLLVLDQVSGEFEQYTNLQGLSHTDLRDILLDSNGRLWLAAGAPVGDVNIWDPETGIHQQISLDQTGSVSLNEITAHGDEVFGAAVRNLENVVIHYSRLENGEYEYKDFYNQFPEMSGAIHDIEVFRDRIYLATSQGLIHSDSLSRSPNLKTSDSWGKVAVGDSFPAIMALYQYENLLYCSVDSRLLEYDGEIFQDAATGFFPGGLSEIRTIGGQLYVGTTRGLYRRSDTGWDRLGEYQLPVTSIRSGDDGKIWVGTEGFGLGMWDGNAEEWKIWQPNGPFSNQFSAMAYSSSGWLIAANAAGVALYDGESWKNVLRLGSISGRTRGLAALLVQEGDAKFWRGDTISYRSARPFAIAVGSDDNVYISHEGAGVLRLNLEDIHDYEVFDTTGNRLSGSAGIGSGTPTFIVSRGVVMDNTGNLWIANAFASNGNGLAARTPQGEWAHFNINDAGVGNALNLQANHLAVDNQNRIWIGSLQSESDPQSAGGVGMLDFGGTLFDQSDDRWYWINRSQGLDGMSILGMDITSQNKIYIINDSEDRVATYRIPTTVESEDDIRLRADQTEQFLSNFSINGVYVDARDNAWFPESSNGVKMRKANGELLNDAEGYNTGNSPLISDQVYAISSNPNTGVVYFATAFGISAVTTPYATPEEDFSQIYTFPSPFYIPNDQEMVIDQLPDEVEVKILTLNGEVVRTLTPDDNEVRNRQAFWDGRDRNGNLVGSGVYFLYCYTQEGKVETTKALVIRK